LVDLALFLQAHVAVASELAVFPQRAAGASRDETADDDVLLEALERIDLALDRRFREDAGGFLEGRRREERAGLQRGLGDAQQDARALGGLTSGLDRRSIGFLEFQSESTASPLSSVVEPPSEISTFFSIWLTMTSMCLSSIGTPCRR
jgi:hypothetical protein